MQTYHRPSGHIPTKSYNRKLSTLPPIGVTPLDAAWRAYEAATTDAERNAAMQHIIAARKAEAGHVYKGSL